MHKEVEVKARLKDPDTFLTRAAKLGIQFTPPVTQHDRVFSPKNLGDFTKFHPGVSFLRIRQEDDRSTLTLKISNINELENTEIESEIGDAHAIEEILLNLDYVLSVEVEKERRTANYRGIVFCLDEVVGLGTFIELEKIMAMDTDVVAVQDELFDFLEEFGVSKSDQVAQGYDTLFAIAQNKIQ